VFWFHDSASPLPARNKIRASNGTSHRARCGNSERDLCLAVAVGTSRYAGRPGRLRRAGRPGHCIASVVLIGAASEDLVGAARRQTVRPAVGSQLEMEGRQRCVVRSPPRMKGRRRLAECGDLLASFEHGYRTSARSSLGYEDPYILFLKSLPTFLLFRRRLRPGWLPHQRHTSALSCFP
jgi:hypothetical protein